VNPSVAACLSSSTATRSSHSSVALSHVSQMKNGTGVALGRVVARDVAVHGLELVDEAVLEQEVERAVHGRRRGVLALALEPIQQVVGLHRLALACDELEHPAPERGELERALLAHARDLVDELAWLVPVLVLAVRDCAHCRRDSGCHASTGASRPRSPRFSAVGLSGARSAGCALVPRARWCRSADTRARRARCRRAARALDLRRARARDQEPADRPSSAPSPMPSNSGLA
jgi:hypothetical protein